MAVTAVVTNAAIEVVNNNTRVIEVVGPTTVITPIQREISVVEVALPGGSVVNVGAGPTLPTNPYEGQIWIKT